MNEPNPIEAQATVVMTGLQDLQLELQRALHELHQLCDQSDELDAARAELETLRPNVDALNAANIRIELLNQELSAAIAHNTAIQAPLEPGALLSETLRGWRFAAESALSLIEQGKADLDIRVICSCLLTTITELEATRVQLAAIRGELAARAHADALLAEDVDDTARAAAEAAADAPPAPADDTFHADLELLDSRELSPGI